MYRVRLLDGTEFASAFCAARSGVLTMSITSELAFLQIAEIFSDPEKTNEITFLYGEMSDTHEGYTDLFLINGVNAGDYLISLRRAN